MINMLSQCNKLRRELERVSEMPSNLFDALFEYRLWWEIQSIQSESENGWPLPFCFEYKNIKAFAKYWKGG